MGETMIERVARAVVEGEYGKGAPVDVDDLARARMAIEAIKTPDDDMKIAGAAVLHRTALSSRESAASWTFQAMIDKALA